MSLKDDMPPVLEPVHYADVMDEVFDRLGGVEALLEWAELSNDNRREFYKLIAKRIPQEVTGEGGGPVLIQLKTL